MDTQARLEAARSRQAALKRITSAMARQVELDPQAVFAVALPELARSSGAPMACLHLADPEAQALRLVAGHGLDPVWSRAWSSLSLEGIAVPARVQAAGRGLALRGGQAPPGLAALVCAPVRGAELTVGVLSLLWPGQNGPAQDQDDLDQDAQDDLEFLETAGHLLGMSIEHAGLVSELLDNLDEVRKLQRQAELRGQELAHLNTRLQEANERLAELSITDPLTGLRNRRYFFQRLEEEILRSRRLDKPLCLAMADLDHFKRVNDQLGHQAGDQALTEFAAVLKAGVREVDLVGRYGGEEFALALLDCDLQAGLKVAEKLRQALKRATKHPPFAALGGITVSLGVAQLAGGMQAEEIIAAADRALYRAKRDGRDRVAAEQT